MDDHEHNSNIIDPRRGDILSDDRTQDWIEAATAAILLISAIVAIIKHSSGEDDRRY